MKDKIKFIFITFHTWQLLLFSTVGAVVITDLVTALVSLWFWHEIQIKLIVLGTLNATLVPLLLLPVIIRSLKREVQLEEQNRSHMEIISRLEGQRQMEATLQRRADEMALLYKLGISLAAGRDLSATLLALQNEIINLIQMDALFVAIYDEETDMVAYPVFFMKGEPARFPMRRLSERPGLSGAVIYGRATLYLQDILADEVINQYDPVDDSDLVLHTFLGIPLVVNGRSIGVLSVQSGEIDAYSENQIHLMENVAVQAAIAIDKANLLDQVKQELADRKHVETQLREREAILKSITFAAEQFLKSSDWRANMDIVLERLGKTLNVTHAYLFEHHVGERGVEDAFLAYEWTAAGFPSDFDNPYYQVSHPLQEAEDSIDDRLSRGEIFFGNASNFPDSEKARLIELGIKSMVEVPVLVNEVWRGTIGFDDFVNEREWSSAEMYALKIATGILSAAIQRQNAEAAVRESERIYRQAIEAADAVPYYLDYKEQRYMFIGSGIEKITGYKPEEVKPDLWRGIMTESIPLGESRGLSLDEADRRSRSGDIKIWKLDMHIRARNGEERWLTDSAIELFDNEEISYAAIGILQDITERKQIENNLRQREVILNAVAVSAELLFKVSDWRTEIGDMLERLGRAINASHAYLFENHEMLGSMRFQWAAPNMENDIENPQYHHVPLLEPGLERWYEALRRGQPYIGDIVNSSQTEIEIFESRGMKAVLDVPIFVNGAWWGTAGFDDVLFERIWSSAEVAALIVAANVLGAAIQRQLDEEALRIKPAQDID